MKNENIAIIGSGFTGLVAAYQLSKKGYKVEIFESTNNIGGLASGIKINGESIEKTYHHIFKSDNHVIKFIKELEIEDKLIWGNSSIAIYYNNSIYQFMSPVDLLKFKYLNVIDKFRLGMTIFYLQRVTNWKKFRNITAHKWLMSKCGKKAYEIIWKPILKSKFSSRYKEISMVWFWARIYTRSKSNNNLIRGEKLGYFKGGFDIILNTIKSKLEKNDVNINLNSEVNKIIQGDKTIKIKLSNNNYYEFNKVICTAPSNIFADLIKNNKNISKNYIKQLKNIDYLGVICILFSSKQSLSNYYWHNINDTNFPFVVFVQHTNLIDKSNYGNDHIYYLCTYAPHDHIYFQEEENKIYDIYLSNLKKIFPTFNYNDIKQKYLFKFKYAQHIVDKDYEKKIPSYITPIENLYLANFSQIFPEDRGVNFAVREGIKVSDLINK